MVGIQVGTSTLENSVEVPQKVKNRATLDSAIALLGIYPKSTDVVKRRAIYTPMFTAALSTIAKLWKEPRCPSTDEWKRRCGPYIQWNITQVSDEINIYHLHRHRWNWRGFC